MARANLWNDGENRFLGIAFECPGCGHRHYAPVRDWLPAGAERAPRADAGATWEFDGNLERPTLSPSVNITTGHFVDGTPPDACWLCRRAREDGGRPFCGRCHFHVRRGRIQFCTDSTHGLAGQTVDLPELA